MAQDTTPTVGSMHTVTRITAMHPEGILIGAIVRALPNESGMIRVEYTTHHTHPLYRGTMGWERATDLTPATVHIDNSPLFPVAYIDVTDRWNGFACPWFTTEVAHTIIEWANTENLAAGEPAALAYDTEAGVFTDTYDYGDDISGTEAFATIERDGVTLHGIGTGSWTWAVTE